MAKIATLKIYEIRVGLFQSHRVFKGFSESCWKNNFATPSYDFGSFFDFRNSEYLGRLL